MTTTDCRTNWETVRGKAVSTEQPMQKQVSSLNTLWLIQCLRSHHPEVDINLLVKNTFSKGPFFIQNLQTGRTEPVAIDHLEGSDYWFSNIFMMALYCTIEEHCADRDFAYKCGSTFYQLQSRMSTAVGIPIIGPYRLIKRIVRENRKYNRTKTAVLRLLSKGHAVIRLIHQPDIIMKDFAIKWHLGLFESYARLAGVSNISSKAISIESGPQRYGDPGQAIYDFEITFRDPGFFNRILHRLLYALPVVRELIEGTEQIQARHNEEILNRDNVIRARTVELVEANETMRGEIAERIRAEEALLQSQEQLQGYIDAIDDIGLGLCVVDAKLQLRVMNKTMIAWFGDHCGEPCNEIDMKLESDTSTHYRLRDAVLQAGKVRYSSTMADGRCFDVVATPISNSDGSRSKMLIIRDITEQRQQEQQRLEISRQKEQLKKLASLKNMAGAIAHRFNNAMVSVQGNLELLTLFLSTDSREHRMAAQAFKAAKGASQIGSVMLGYVGQQPLNPRRSSLEELAREAVAASEPLLHSAIDLQFLPPQAGSLYCSIDKQQMKQVMVNILTNAVESLEDGPGTIKISFGIDYFAKEDFPIFFQEAELQNGVYAFCRIKDSGSGISTENLAQVFEPFYTTKFLGRGLGLALAAGIMQTHHGAITVGSTPKHGTSVRLLLPILEPPVQRNIFIPGDVKVEETRFSENILLVDDETDVLDVGRTILATLGFTVDTAVDGKSAIDKVRGRNTNYRVIIMDISMPEFDGIKAMQHIREIDSTIPIILSSGYSESDFLFNKDQGSRPDGFLPKPFNISDMKKSLESLLSVCSTPAT